MQHGQECGSSQLMMGMITYAICTMCKYIPQQQFVLCNRGMSHSDVTELAKSIMRLTCDEHHQATANETDKLLSWICLLYCVVCVGDTSYTAALRPGDGFYLF